jgi:soluble lytic murein transglycosylase
LLGVALSLLLSAAGVQTSTSTSQTSKGRKSKSKPRKKPAPSKPPPPKAVGAAGLIAVAQHELDQGNYAAAAEYASAAGSKAPILNDYAQYVRAQAEYRLRNYKDIDKAVTQIFTFQPLSPLIGPAAALAVNANLDGDEPKQALELIRKYLDRIPQPQADLLYARCFQANGDLPQAAEYYQRVYYNYPVAREAAEAATTLAEIQPRMGDAYPPPMPAAMLGRAEKLINYHRPAEARIELTAAIPKLGGVQRELAQVRLGEVDFFSGNPRVAFDYLNTLKVTDAEADAERLYYLVKSARRQERSADVKPFLEELAKGHANSSWRMRALIDVANEARTQNDATTMLDLYGTCASVFGRHPEAAICNWRRAYNAFHSQSVDALDLLRTYVEQFPDTEDTTDALYFLGRWYEKKGDVSSARAAFDALVLNFPNTYFGILGLDRLKLPDLKSATPAPETQAFLHAIAWSKRDASTGFKPSATGAKRLERAELLQLTGLDGLAEGELKFGARNDEDQNNIYAMQLAKYALARNAPDDALHAIKLYAPGYLYLPLDDAPLEFWQLAFPIPFRGAIEYYSKQQNLDPFLVAALIRQESDFNIKEVSDAHAYGLMQLIPGTARSMARHFSIRRVNTADLMTAGLNIQLGTYYLRDLLDHFNGQMEWVLAAYNAGPGRSNLWRNWGPFEETADLIEVIPFHETRLYVQIVERNADIYRRLYAGRTPDVPAYTPKTAPRQSKHKKKAKRAQG